MKFDTNLNYCILSNSIDKNLLSKLDEYTIINDSIAFNEIVEKIENYNSKTIVFNEVLRLFNKGQIKKIISLLNTRKIKFINITSDIEETLLSDYIIVFNNNDIVMEGTKETILKEEKLLKRLGYGLPFVVDLSTQLMCYNVVDNLYFDIESLVKELWD